jgi:muramoyltetrapeptide carboxypeptidase
VTIVSPAGPVTPELLEPGLELLEDWELDVVLDDDLYERHPPGYLAGDDPTRLDALQRALDHPDHGAVVFSRGGYGTMRLLEGLEFQGLRRHPKWLVGFSDLTALHLYVAGVEGMATLHAPVVKSLRLHDDGDASQRALRAALFGERADERVVEGLETIRRGTARGPLLGGNLTLLVNMLSTPFCPDLEGTILIVEDVGEEDYRLDRLWTALRLSERTDGLAGLVLGNFDDCGGTYLDDDEMPDFVRRLALEFDCPVAAGLPIGHGAENIALPMGRIARLEADEERLVFESQTSPPP